MDRLTLPKDEFKIKLELQIAEGRAILDTFIKSDSLNSFDKLERAYKRWDVYNYRFIEQAFNDPLPASFAIKYQEAGAAELKQIASIQSQRTDNPAFKQDFFADFVIPKIEYLEDIRAQLDFMYHVAARPLPPPPADSTASSALASLHPTIQQVASSLYATGHYRQALLDAFIAVDNAVQAKSHLTHTGTQLMEVAFSANNPILKIGDSNNEQQGFMALFRGAMLAIRNPKAHSLNGTHDAQRALEWLSFASVLLRNLDEAVLQQPAPPAP